MSPVGFIVSGSSRQKKLSDLGASVGGAWWGFVVTCILGLPHWIL